MWGWIKQYWLRLLVIALIFTFFGFAIFALPGRLLRAVTGKLTGGKAAEKSAIEANATT